MYGKTAIEYDLLRAQAEKEQPIPRPGDFFDEPNLLYPRSWTPGYTTGFVLAPLGGALLGSLAKRPATGALVGLGILVGVRGLFSFIEVTKAVAAQSRLTKFLPGGLGVPT